MSVSSHAFAELLQTAVTEPGIISSANRQFHTYGIGSQSMAWSRCRERAIQPGPIAAFMGWKEKGRYVKKGEKAITLCRPVSVKRKASAEDGSEDSTATWFVYKPYWFVLAQTEGETFVSAPIPAWDRTRALEATGVTEIRFDSVDGNVHGLARGRSITLSPLNPMPHKTTFHEMAHVLLGHTVEGEQAAGGLTSRNLRECEAEAVALLCCAASDPPGVEYSRGYIQRWWGQGNVIPGRSAQRVLKVADQILKAGTTNQTDAKVTS